MAAAKLDGIDAPVDCRGAGVIPAERSGLSAQRPRRAD